MIRARGQYAAAKRHFASAHRRVTALEDEGIMQGQMWEHANRQAWDATRRLNRAHKELWMVEQRLAVPENYRESHERR